MIPLDLSYWLVADSHNMRPWLPAMQCRDTNIFGSKRAIQIFGESEHISVGARFFENRSTPQLVNQSTSRLKHGSLRTGAHLSWSTVLREPEHISVLQFMHPCMMHWWFKQHSLAVTVWSKSQKNIGGKGVVKRHGFNNQHFCQKLLFLGPKMAIQVTDQEFLDHFYNILKDW